MWVCFLVPSFKAISCRGFAGQCSCLSYGLRRGDVGGDSVIQVTSLDLHLQPALQATG